MIFFFLSENRLRYFLQIISKPAICIKNQNLFAGGGGGGVGEGRGGGGGEKYFNISSAENSTQSSKC